MTEAIEHVELFKIGNKHYPYFDCDHAENICAEASLFVDQAVIHVSNKMRLNRHAVMSEKPQRRGGNRDLSAAKQLIWWLWCQAEEHDLIPHTNNERKAKYFGHNNHTCVTVAIKTVNGRMEVDKYFKNHVMGLWQAVA